MIEFEWLCFKQKKYFELTSKFPLLALGQQLHNHNVYISLEHHEFRPTNKNSAYQKPLDLCSNTWHASHFCSLVTKINTRWRCCQLWLNIATMIPHQSTGEAFLATLDLFSGGKNGTWYCHVTQNITLSHCIHGVYWCY